MLVKYKQNDSLYNLTNIVKMKQANGDWVMAAQYENGDGQVFVRELGDFCAKFIVVDEPEVVFYFALEHGYGIEIEDQVYNTVGVDRFNNGIISKDGKNYEILNLQDEDLDLEVNWKGLDK